MHYEINVSLNGMHFFATHARSITDLAKCRKVYDSLRVAFPESEGYEIAVQYIETSGRYVDMDRNR